MSDNSSSLKDIIRAEYIKCAQSPIYFIKKYCYIQHPLRGKVLFSLYPFQLKVLKLFTENDYCIVNKSRQLGISTLISCYSLWLMLFHEDKNILVIATKQDVAKNLVDKVKYSYDALPSWLKEEALEYNKLSLKLKNGSKVKATSAASDAGRSEAVSLLVIDEAAFIDGVREIWGSSQQTLATGGKSIVISTPYGTGNWFHEMWEKAEMNIDKSGQIIRKEDLNGPAFLPIRLPWTVHPERDQAWRDKQDILLGDPRIAAQECDASFETSGDTVFHSEWLEFIENNNIKEPINRIGINKDYWIWENVDYTKEYMVVADVARGDGKDYSTAQIIEIESNIQVGEFKGQIPTREFGRFLVGLATSWNEALLVIENSNVGWDTLGTVMEMNYKNLYYSSKTDQLTSDDFLKNIENNSNTVPGFTTSLRTRPLIINKLREMVGDRSLTIQSKRTLSEMKVFIWKNGRAEAQQGRNDDLVIPLAISQYLRETALKYKHQNLELTKATLSSFSKLSTPFRAGYKSKMDNNPFKIKNPYGGDEDISWLIR